MPSMRLLVFPYEKLDTASSPFHVSRSNTESVRVSALRFSAEAFFARDILGHADSRYWPIAFAYSPENGGNHPFRPSAQFAALV